MLMTRAYKAASESGTSAVSSANFKIDAANDYLWRFNRRRLDAEEIRDAMLAVAGDLDKSVRGPHPFPPGNTFKYTPHVPFFAAYHTQQRSVYLMQQPLRQEQLLHTLD